MSRVHWVALAMGGRIGGKTIAALQARFGSLEAALNASQAELQCIPGIGPAAAQFITSINLAAVEEEIAEFEAKGIRVITRLDQSDYPPYLGWNVESPPAVLFMRGTLSFVDRTAIAIVGTRWPSLHGRQLARNLAFEFARHGWTVVSGLALGIDTAAHEGALDARGRTIAVLGSGLEQLYPPENARLAEEIIANGAILSEVHPRAGVSKQRLIARNRITSGLSQAVIVIEAGTDGGSINTARRAQKQGRRVFAVVGGDRGCDMLLREGAIPLYADQMDWNNLLQWFAESMSSTTPSQFNPD